VLVLDKTSVKLSIRGQSSQPAVYQHWTFVPAGSLPDPFLDDNQDDEVNNLMELHDLKDEVAELKEKIAEKDSIIKDKDEEINQLKELIEALSVPEAPAVDPVPEAEADAGQAAIAIVLFDFEVIPGTINIYHLRHILKSNIRPRKTLK
jgi:DNA repair exonuclease SbcCD ATPase subunit